MRPKEQLKQYHAELEELSRNFESRLSRRAEEIDIMQFDVQRTLGSGTFGSVYKATRRGKLFAIKVMKKKTCNLCAVSERKYLSAMESRFIPKLHGVFQTFMELFMYLDFATYGDLFEVLMRTGPLRNRRAMNFFYQVVCAIEYMHACNIIHRDVKPQNILVFEGGRLKLSDLGLAIESAVDLNQGIGTVYIRPPEMYSNQFYTDSVDWWALGMTIYFAVFVGAPFSIQIDDPPERIKERLETENLTFPHAPPASDRLKDLLRKLLEKDPLSRLGAAPGGAKDVKDHPWFGTTDFCRILFGNDVIENLNLAPFEGKAYKGELDVEDLDGEPDPGFEEF